MLRDAGGTNRSHARTQTTRISRSAGRSRLGAFLVRLLQSDCANVATARRSIYERSTEDSDQPALVGGMQRYLENFPARGEIVIFDRSWYNRLGVEHVMGFCTPEQHQRALKLIPQLEKFIVEGGTILIKLWLEVSNAEQKRRFEARVKDPLRQWKLSPMDLPSRKRWYDYSRARDIMLKHTDTKSAPWYIVRSDDKRSARLNTIAHVLSSIPHKKLPHKKVKLPSRSTKGAYNDDATIARRRYVRERY